MLIHLCPLFTKKLICFTAYVALSCFMEMCFFPHFKATSEVKLKGIILGSVGKVTRINVTHYNSRTEKCSVLVDMVDVLLLPPEFLKGRVESGSEPGN